MINILFTGAGRRIELIQAFRQAALVLNKQIRILGADITRTAPALAYCDAIKIVKQMKDPDYISNLIEVCKEEKIDIVIPTIDTDLLVLSKNKELFEKEGIKVLISAPDKILICRDKNNTSKFFVDCGLSAPMPVNDWKKYNSGYPAFIKPKDGSSSINAFKVNNEEELKTYSAQIEDYIVQPFIEGEEYTVDVFCDFEGNPIFITPRQRVQVRAGEVLKTKIAQDETVQKEIKALCAAFKPCGPLTVQFIRQNGTNINYYIEINPRFGGGAPLSMKAGAKSAEAVLKLIDGEKVDSKEYTLQDGAVYSRFDQSVQITNSINEKIKGIIFDLDDTLCNEIDYIKSGFKAVAEYLGDAKYFDALMNYYEQGKKPINALLEDIHQEDKLAGTVKAYRENKPELTLNSEAKETLTKLREKGIKIGIITDGRPEGQRAKIEALGLEELVDDIIITDELGGKQFRKPNDISFRIMQNRWRLNSEEIVYVGDNLNKDQQAPKQLGMNFVFFNNQNGIYTDKTNTDYIEINSISELFAIRGVKQ